MFSSWGTAYQSIMIQEYCGVRVSRSLRLAIPVENTREILQIQHDEISRIPGVAPWLLGTINQKGNLLWVIHIESFLGLKSSPIPNPIIALVVNFTLPDRSIRRIACMVSEMEEIFALDSEELRSLPDRLPGRAQQLFKGLVKHSGLFRAVLDPEALFRILNPTLKSLTHNAEVEIESDFSQIPIAT